MISHPPFVNASLYTIKSPAGELPGAFIHCFLAFQIEGLHISPPTLYQKIFSDKSFDKKS